MFKRRIAKLLDDAVDRTARGAIDRAAESQDPVARSLGPGGVDEVRTAAAAFARLGIHVDAEDALGLPPQDSKSQPGGGHIGNPFKRMRDPVEGSMHVVGCTALDPRAMRAPCHITYVIQAPGVTAFSGEKVFELWSRQWPSPGDDLPVVFDRAKPEHVEILTDRIESHADSARRHADELAAQLGGSGGAPSPTSTGEGTADHPPGSQPVRPIVIGDADPERVQDALRRASQLLGVDLGAAAPTGGGASNPGAEDDKIGRLERLAKLRDSGVLTAQEFEAQKQAILTEPG